MTSQPAWVFKKVDSILRGNPRVEIEAVMQSGGQRRAVLIPANPTRGRVIAEGRYFIDGTPLDQTPFAHDPDYPRTSADVLTMLASDNDEFVHAIRVGSPLPADGIIVPDIDTQTELVHRAGTADAATLVAGAADFFAALLNERCAAALTPAAAPTLALTPPALLICGSRTAWPPRRDACLAAGVPVATIDQPIAEGCAFGALVLGIGESNPTDQTSLLSRLADRTAIIMQSNHIQTLLAEGGATAAEIAGRSGWMRLAVVASAPAGIGVLRPIAPDAPLVLIKPGSYPWPAEIWDAFCRCRTA
jgi:uncharacterized protein YgbK (DUF1537 family)